MTLRDVMDAMEERRKEHELEAARRKWRVTLGAIGLGLAIAGALVAFLALSACGVSR